MAYSILHLSRNNQRTHLIVDDVTTLPVMFATIYGMNELSKKHLGTQENILCSLRFFYVYYFKKHKRTFDYDFYRSVYNISCFIRELDGFFTYLLGKQHLSDETDIISTGFLHSALSRTNKSTYGNHVRNVGRFLKYLNYRYMNLAYQDMSPVEAHQINQANHRDLADRIKVFNRVDVSRNEPAHRYKSITSQQSVELTNMLIPSTPEFSDIETGELFTAVVNPQNPFDSGFQQYRNYLIHRLMFNYGLRVGEVQLLLKDCVGPTLPDARGNIRFILIVQNLPDDVVDPRKQQPSLKTEHSQRQIELTEDDFIIFTIYMEQYRSPLFEEKKIDPAFIVLFPHYRTKSNKIINNMVNITPHVGRHTWANITLEFIYNSLLSESLILAQDYGIRARMNGVPEPAIEQLRALGGWSLTSKVPLRYAKRFIEVVSNQSNYKRTKHSDMHLASPGTNISQTKTYNLLEDNVYDEDFTFKDLFN